MWLVDVFRAKIVDISDHSLTIEVMFDDIDQTIQLFSFLNLVLVNWISNVLYIDT